jgi:glutamate/tyrosine decarboxylase-like PLP-dependent enzyme
MGRRRPSATHRSREHIRRDHLEALDRHHAGLKLQGSSKGIPEAWFLGPKAENEELFKELIAGAILAHTKYRRSYHPEDPLHITPEIKRSKAYRDAVADLRAHSRDLFATLTESAPVFSMRSQGHMLWDQVVPAYVGYFAAMLYNQNNVAAEASPVTTRLEIEVGNDLCRMLGYRVPGSGKSAANAISAWGHITCDGSVANIEALWVARNAKLFAVALRAALRESPELAAARDIQVQLLNGRRARLVDLDTWVALNLPIDEVVRLPQAIAKTCKIPVDTITAALEAYTVQNIGLIDFYRRFMSDVPYAPVAMVTTTRHYSWPKGGALLGLGQNNVLGIHVDLQGRMQIPHLVDMLNICLQRHIPVMAVVAVIGSTEESSVDPLKDILDVRETFRRKGLDFAVHCDAAWGGYFNSMLRRGDVPADDEEVPTFPMSRYVRDQYRAMRQADSITVDPHKAGYVPYPAGALCYRNAAMRDLVSLRAPVVFHSQSEPTVGVYGIEGSKPGAAAAAVYLAHKVIRPDRSGYGRILGQCMWTSKRMYSRLVTMEDPRFKLVVFQMLPAERENRSEREIQAQRDYIRRHFVNTNNANLDKLLKRDAQARRLFMEIGSDQVILAFSCNFVDRTGKWNTSVQQMNALNDTIFSLCSVTNPIPDLNKLDLILTSSSFDPRAYGQPFVDHYARRLGVHPEPGLPVSFLISTTMDPWTTDTSKGDFLETVESALRNAVHQAIDKIPHPAKRAGQKK